MAMRNNETRYRIASSLLLLALVTLSPLAVLPQQNPPPGTDKTLTADTDQEQPANSRGFAKGHQESSGQPN